jgi:hypothetical protein
LAASVLWASAMMLTGAAQAGQQQGLVNVNIENVTVQIPISVAANICGVSVNVLVDEITQGSTKCRDGAIALAEDADSAAGQSSQEGLINVNITDVDVQAPIAVAADVCGVAVNVLVQDLKQGPVDCEAYGQSAAVSR